LRRVVVAILHVLDPRTLGEFALYFELAELLGDRPQGLVRVGNRATCLCRHGRQGSQPVALMAMINSTWRKLFKFNSRKIFANRA